MHNAVSADLIGEEYQPIEPDKKELLAKLVEGLLGRRSIINWN